MCEVVTSVLKDKDKRGASTQCVVFSLNPEGVSFASLSNLFLGSPPRLKVRPFLSVVRDKHRLPGERADVTRTEVTREVPLPPAHWCGGIAPGRAARPWGCAVQTANAALRRSPASGARGVSRREAAPRPRETSAGAPAPGFERRHPGSDGGRVIFGVHASENIPWYLLRGEGVLRRSGGRGRSWVEREAWL